MGQHLRPEGKGIHEQQPAVLRRRCDPETARPGRAASGPVCTTSEAVLACASVDPASYVVQEHPDGSVVSRPIDPDPPDWSPRVFDPELASRLRTLAREAQVTVEFRELARDVAHALSRLAEVLDAEMIVVGTRRRGMAATMAEQGPG